jgi:hypothetical protein
MLSAGAGFGLLVLAIYLVFLTENGWLRMMGGLYLGFFFLLSFVAAIRSTEPALHLAIPGFTALLMLFAQSIRSKWKNWP